MRIAEKNKQTLDFKSPYAHATLKQMSVSVCGVKQRNSLENDFRCCSDITQCALTCQDDSGSEFLINKATSGSAICTSVIFHVEWTNI